MVPFNPYFDPRVIMLAPRQQEVLNFIKGFVKNRSYPPTHREIKQGLNMVSCSYLNRVLNKLESMSFIKRETKRTKHNIRLLQSPYSLPILGKIAAGSPIEALNQPEEFMLMEKLMGENRYLLRVKGQSMIEENICDGDLIVCERCEQVIDGTIVVALINKQEATLKKIYYKGGKIHLKPANKDYETQVYDPEEVEIQGKFVGLIRLK